MQLRVGVANRTGQASPRAVNRLRAPRKFCRRRRGEVCVRRLQRVVNQAGNTLPPRRQKHGVPIGDRRGGGLDGGVAGL